MKKLKNKYKNKINIKDIDVDVVLDWSIKNKKIENRNLLDVKKENNIEKQYYFG